MVKKIISIVLIIVLQLTMIPGALASQKNVATAEFGYALKIDGFENAEMATEAGPVKEFKDWKYCWVLDRSQDNKKATINLKSSDNFKPVSDFDGSVLYETIPNFHNTKKRLDTLFASAEKDVCGRRTEVEAELDYIRTVSDMAADLSIRYANGELPTRVTHNDTKANNVLFDRVTKRPITVIDLDTVMPGMAMYDFGDAVRFIANTAVEDESDLSKVYFDTAKFRAFAKGFIKEVKNAWTDAELHALVLASFSITIEQTARFLTDYLDGDTYFKTNYPTHNLVRTRCQMRLAQDIQRKWEELESIVREVLEQTV